MFLLNMYVSLTPPHTGYNKIQWRDDLTLYPCFGRGCLRNTWYSFLTPEASQAFGDVSRMRTMRRRSRRAGVTDCRASDQMGTRDCEMSERLWIYTLPAPLRSATSTLGQSRTKRAMGVDVKKYGHRVIGQRCERISESSYKDERKMEEQTLRQPVLRGKGQHQLAPI